MDKLSKVEFKGFCYIYLKAIMDSQEYYTLKRALNESYTIQITLSNSTELVCEASLNSKGVVHVYTVSTLNNILHTLRQFSRELLKYKKLQLLKTQIRL